MAIRFVDDRRHATDFAHEVWAECPRCAELAIWRAGRTTCGACGLDRTGGSVTLWLRAELPHGTLWAYNPEHLAWLRRFVAAKLRERPHTTGFARNTTMASRLPRWLKSQKTRGAILRAIDRLARQRIY